MQIKKFILLFIFYVFCGYYAISQPAKPSTTHNLTAELKLQYGLLMSHHLELDVFRSHFPAFEISLQKATYGKKRWEAEYGYPIIGLSFWYSGLGGFPELGSAFAIYPTINFPIVRDNNQSFNFKLGLGLGYLTNSFDRINNYKNFAIGSRLNIVASLFFEYRRIISKMITISAGFGLTHFSNGSMKTPNYGINILMGSIGITSYLSNPNRSLDRKILPELYPFEFDGRKYLSIDFATAVAYKDMTEQFGKKFFVMAGFVNIMARVSYKSKFGIGLDLTHDESDKHNLERQYIYVTNNFHLTKLGINAAYELVMDRLSFLFNAGVYLSGLDRSEGDVYQRLSLKYHLTDKFFANMVLSAHLGRAEYVGFGLGYRVKFIYKRKIKHD